MQRLTEAFTSGILDRIPAMVAYVDAEDRFCFANQAYRDWAGREDLVGKTRKEVLPGDLWEKSVLRKDAALKGQTTKFEDRVAGSDGSYYYVQVEYLPERDQSGALAGYLVVVNDITHLKEREEALRKQQRLLEDLQRSEERLQAALRAREEFLSIASHELKTPLTSLKLLAQMRLRLLERKELGYFTPGKLRLAFEEDDQQINRLTRLIDDLLDFSRVNSGHLMLLIDAVDLEQLIREVSRRMLPHLQAAGCPLNLYSNGPVIGQWDRIRIEQIYTNLLTNAIRYAPHKPVHVTVSKQDNNAVLVVRDEGFGIRPEQQSKIFECFERAQPSASFAPGLGLGLYLCRRIAESHGGRIWVESPQEGGARFHVSLPLFRASRPQGEESS